jgi:PAS domain S-box-containing protein
MQFSLPTATLGAALGALVLAGAFLYIRRFGDERALGWWSAALIANAVRQTLNFIAAITASEALEPLSHLSLIAMSSLALIGALNFADWPAQVKWVVAATAAAVAWTCFGVFADLSFLARNVPIYGLSGVAFFAAGVAFMSARRQDPGFGYTLVGVCWMLWGLHIADTPFLWPFIELRPWGFLLSQTLMLAIVIGLIVIIQRRQSQKLLAANRRAEESASGLAAAERRFRDFAEVASDWLWEMGPDLRFTYVSANIERSIGMNPRHSIGKRPDELLDTTRDAEKLRAHFADLEAGRPFRDFGFRTRLPNEREVYLVISGKPMFDASGRFLGYRGTGRDGTAELEADQRATTAQRHLLDAFQALSNGIALFDRDDRMIICNAAYRQFTGLDEQTLKPGISYEQILRTRIAQNLLPLPPEETVETFITRRMEQHRNPRGPIERLRANGRWSLISEQRLVDGGYVLVAYDITAAKERERDLAEKTQLLQSTLENMGEGISVYDANLRMVSWNEKLIEIVGLPRSMYKVGTPFEDIVRFSAERGEYGPGDIEEMIRERISASTMAKPHRNARWRVNGRYVELRRNPMPGGGFVTVYSDLTESKRAEDALRDAKEAAEAANRTKSEILANMSHELRTPLNAIIGFSDIILRETFGAVGQPRYLDYARDIYESGTHLLALINDILDVSKAEAGRIELLEGRVDVGELIDSCLRLVHARADEAKIELVATLSEELPALHADGLRLKQVLLNLMSNAIKFTPAGGRVTLKAETADGHGLHLRVIDTGIGMAPEDIPKALSPFGQLETSMSRRYPGTGLGLPLSKALVELHGGRLHIDSVLGKGTTVTISLPHARMIVA